jgi:hypothetical protein
MEDYNNVVLVKIDETRVVVVDGEEYLVVDPSKLNGLRTTYQLPSYKQPEPKTDDLKEAIYKILDETPGLQSSEIMGVLKNEYDLRPTVGQLASALQRLRAMDKIVVEGVKRNARWYPAETEEG